MTDKNDKEIESKKEKSVASRRVFLTSGLFALINIPIIALLFKRFNQKQASFSFDGPFFRGEKFYFDESIREKLPFFAASLVVGSNDIAIFYYPAKSDRKVRMIVSLNLSDENNQELSSQSQPLTVDWSEDDLFSGLNIRYQFPEPILLKAQKVTVKIQEIG